MLPIHFPFTFTASYNADTHCQWLLLSHLVQAWLGACLASLHTQILDVLLLTCCATCWQVEYAALDALCLLMLLDNMIACAPPQHSTHDAPSLAETSTAQPSESDNQQASVDAALPSKLHHKLSSLDGAASGQPAAPRQQQTDACNVSESSHDALHTASMSSRCAQAHLSTIDMRDSIIHKAPDASKQSPGSTKEAAAAADSSGPASGSSPDQTRDEKSADLQTSHGAAIQQAVQHWACRLEMTPAGKAAKPKAKRHLSGRQRAHIRHAVEQQNQIDDVAGEHQLSTCLAGCVCKYSNFLVCADWGQQDKYPWACRGYTHLHRILLSTLHLSGHLHCQILIVWSCTHLHELKLWHLHHQVSTPPGT